MEVQKAAAPQLLSGVGLSICETLCQLLLKVTLKKRLAFYNGHKIMLRETYIKPSAFEHKLDELYAS